MLNVERALATIANAHLSSALQAAFDLQRGTEREIRKVCAMMGRIRKQQQ
jgi:hypothetical protein